MTPSPADVRSLLYGGPLSRTALSNLPALYRAGAAYIDVRLKHGPPFEEGEAFAREWRERFLALAVRAAEDKRTPAEVLEGYTLWGFGQDSAVPAQDPESQP